MKTEEGKQELVFNYLHGKSNPTSQKSPPEMSSNYPIWESGEAAHNH